MSPIGYVVLPHTVRLDRPVQAYGKWMRRIPGEYAEAVLGNSASLSHETNGRQIAQLKNFQSLMPMAQEARKSIFHLKPGDGALGSHFTAALATGKEFEVLARELMSRIGVPIEGAR